MEEKNITFEELKEAATPMVELLQKKGHPYMIAIITEEKVEIMECKKGIPFPYDD